MEQLLAVRKKLKDKKPIFLRQDGHKVKKLEQKWRQPKGMHSKLRKKRKSRMPHPSTGWSSPKSVRGLHRLGLKERYVQSVKDMEGMDRKTEGVLVARVGIKNKVEILKKALELKVTVLNVKEPQAFVGKVEDELKKNKEDKKNKEERKKKSKEESLKKAEDKKKKEEKKEEAKEDSLEDKAKKDKEEQRKVLERKNETY
ncbi:MAG: 50S ribosomal protein L32e [Nanoarchaeota archaeon]